MPKILGRFQKTEGTKEGFSPRAFRGSVALIIPLWTNFAMMKKFIFIVYTYQV
jgi:hypothetical protein